MHFYALYFLRAVLWNLSVRITIQSGRTPKSIVHITFLSGRTVKSISSYHKFYRAVLWNILVRITFLSGRTVKYIGLYHDSISSYHLFVVFWTVAIGILQRVKMLITILERPVPVHIIGLQTIGSHHGIGPELMSSGRIVLQQRAAYILHCTRWILSVWFVSYRIVVGSVLNSLGSYSEFYRFTS
jgi:hypothetical protein